MKIDAGRQQKAASCNVSLVKTYHQLAQETILDRVKDFLKLNRNNVKAYYVIFKLKVISDTGNAHTVFIKVNPDFDLSDWNNNTVQIYCDCEDFKYRSAFTLNKHSSIFLNEKIRSSLSMALSEPPKKKTNTNLLCKHAFASLQWLVNNYSNVMKTI